MKTYKITFYRFNTYVKPMMYATVDVVFNTDFPPDKDDLFNDEFIDIMWKELWKQNPAWLLSHGPAILVFRGWSSVMWKRETLVEVQRVEEDMPEDLTGPGNMLTSMTYHPWLPYDMRTALKKAYERGLASRSLVLKKDKQI